MHACKSGWVWGGGELLTCPYPPKVQARPYPPKVQARPPRDIGPAILSRVSMQEEIFFFLNYYCLLSGLGAGGKCSLTPISLMRVSAQGARLIGSTPHGGSIELYIYIVVTLDIRLYST